MLLLTIVAIVGSAAAAFTQRARIEQMLGAPPPAAALASVDAPVEYGQFVEMEGIVINPQGSSGRRYLMAKVGVEAEEMKTLERLDALGPVARDAILTILSEQTVDDLSDMARRDSLKSEVKTAINTILGEDGPVTRVYFTQFVLQ